MEGAIGLFIFSIKPDNPYVLSLMWSQQVIVITHYAAPIAAEYVLSCCDDIYGFILLIESAAGMAHFCRLFWKLASPWLSQTPVENSNLIFDYCRK